ncbi:ASCH domain-containing protein [Lentilactobacillus kefiri DSM 20587 = JCM 5818]|uniref:ASCH domain-containing protein n=2 Tax=Lentilactobacillus kefiri TaxID=33962 RepID=A0A8E1RKH4_LENKE|nr:ASCH domain-containing protein [Lentilactobacillus kefiri DSM 20587 = JCM 5818]
MNGGFNMDILKMDATEYWEDFMSRSKVHPSNYETWSFADRPNSMDMLADMIIQKRKTAYTFWLDFYDADQVVPKVGDYRMVLRKNGDPVCIIQLKVVEIVPFKWVSQEHAYLEGEGNRSLKYWRQLHKQLFRKQAKRQGKSFSLESPCICEDFEVVDTPQI